VRARPEIRTHVMTRFIALVLTVLTGFTGLVYEVTWQKYLAALLGSHAEATAAVLAIFLGGLSLGYALFGRATRELAERARRRNGAPRLLAFYALVEAGIGGYALLFPALFTLAQAASLWSPAHPATLGFACDVLLSALLMGPPAVLMGGTIPVLTLALAGDLQHATRVHAWIYGFNTLGAFAGALAGVFVLLPWLGLDGTVRAMGCINLLSAAVFALLERRAVDVVPDLAQPAASGPVPRFAAWAGIALLVGFSMMVLQTTANRIGALALGSSQFTFAMVVAVFVLCLALGSLAVSMLSRIPRALVVGSLWALVALLFPIYIATPDVNYWAHWLRIYMGGPDASFYPYQVAIFVALLGVMALPIGLSGALLPLLFHQLRREVRDLGSVAGRLYAWNTLGSLLGALLGGYLLLFWLDLHHIYRIALACLAIGAGILTHLVYGRLPRAVPVLASAATLLAIAWLPAWPAAELTAGAFRMRRALPATFLGPAAFYSEVIQEDVLFFDDDPTSTVKVGRPKRNSDNLALYVNGKSDGALLGDHTTMALSALIPALIAGHPENCFVIGLGTGVSAGELAALDPVRHVTVAEISPAVIAANPLFAAGNLGVWKSPKVDIVRGDAYRTLLRSDSRYDVIVSEPSNPWVSGVEMLYSREFLEAARSHLAPGGVYAQWFHRYETSPEVVALVLRTYASVFSHVSVWYTQRADMLLLGINQPERALDVAALEARFHEPSFAAGFARSAIDRFPQLLTHEMIPLGTLHAEALDGPIHTLRRPILSDWAARSFFSGEMARVVPYSSTRQQELSVHNSLLRRYAGGGDAMPEEIYDAVTHETCQSKRMQDCATYFVRWGIDHPKSKRRSQALLELRKQAGRRSRDLSNERLAELRSLYDGRVPGAFGGLTSGDIRLLTSDYLDYYVHAVPFDRAALASIWRRCRGAGCQEAREYLTPFLWDFDGAGIRSAAAGRE
jgi:spermidine synthase